MSLLFRQHDGVSPLTVALVVAAVLLFGRYLYLRSQRPSGPLSPRSTLPVPLTANPMALPSFGRRWVWPTRKERLDRQTEFVRSHTDYILARMEEAKAMGGLVRARVELEEILASLEPPTRPLPESSSALSPAASALTLQEIIEIVDALPDMPEELRAVLMQLLAGRLAEKVAR